MYTHKKYKDIERWLWVKIRQGKIEEIAKLILLYSKSEQDKYPNFSSFPGNLENEVNYSNSILFKEDSDFNNKLNYPKGLILKVIKYLSPVQSAIFCLRYIDQKTQDEIAKTLGCTHQYVSQIEQNIKAILSNNKYLRDLINGKN